MLKRKMWVFLVLTLSVSLAMVTGCGAKKKVTVVQKQTVKAPEKKPEPKPQVQEAPKPQKVEEEETVPKDLKFVTIYFDFDKSDIRADQRSAISGNALLLSRYKTVKIRVEGHCDERGTNEYNMALGQRRADSVKRYLVDYGIDNSRISTVSYGEERPVEFGHNEASWSKNRRSEFVITSANKVTINN